MVTDRRQEWELFLVPQAEAGATTRLQNRQAGEWTAAADIAVTWKK